MNFDLLNFLFGMGIFWLITGFIAAAIISLKLFIDLENIDTRSVIIILLLFICFTVSGFISMFILSTMDVKIKEL